MHEVRAQGAQTATVRGWTDFIVKRLDLARQQLECPTTFSGPRSVASLASGEDIVRFRDVCRSVWLPKCP